MKFEKIILSLDGGLGMKKLVKNYKGSLTKIFCHIQGNNYIR